MKYLSCLLMLAAMLVAAPAWAQDWGVVANISATMGVNANRLCYGEASRGDIGCPADAPVVSGSTISGTFVGDGSGLTGVTVATDRIVSTTGVASITSDGTVTINGRLEIVTGTSVVAVGRGAGKYNSGSNVAAFGNNAGSYNSNSNVVLIGSNAGYSNSGAAVVGLGTYAGRYNTGDNLTAIGHAAGMNNTGANVTAIGYYAGASNTFNNVTLLGLSVYGADKANQVVLGNGNVVEVSTSGVYVGKGVSTTGPISATYFVGDGSRLTNLPTGATDRISTSGVASGANLGMVVASQGTVSFTLGGTAGAAYLHPTLGLVAPGVSTTGPISATGLYVSGSVGIGTTAPTSQLQFNAIGLQPFYFSRSGFPTKFGIRVTTNGTQDAFSFGSTNYPNSIVITSDSTVGIGATLPSTTLDVNGSVRLAAEASATLNTCDTNRSGAIRYTSGKFQVCYGSGGWANLADASSTVATADRITSGTAQVIANGNSNSISITEAGVTTGYYYNGIWVAGGVSTTGGISMTTGYVSSSLFVGGVSNTFNGLYLSNRNLYIDGVAGLNNGYYININGKPNLAAGTPAMLIGTGISPRTPMTGPYLKLGTYDETGALRGGVYGFTGLQIEANANGVGAHYGSYISMTTSNLAIPYGVYSVVSNGSSGNRAAYAVYADASNTTAGSAWAFYANQGNSYFKDAVGFNTLAPSTTVHVNGSIRLGQETSATTNTCDTNRSGAIRYNGSTFQVCYGTGGWANLADASSTVATADRITSGTAQVIANGASGYVSLTNGASTWGYLGVSQTYLGAANFGGKVGIGTVTPAAPLEVSGTVSATILQLADGPAITCGPSTYGTMKMVNGRPYYCRQ
ncbi:hypothetical protein MesoLj131b_77370 (plasmid) [Mesorhizobium sp. 131-2-5]|uniref:beta strand repeat-containing protein n=1 Tax=Mesorhizobium sp. 131-2-5 TaxID=2744519 RepID=UPI0018ED7DA0|nr:hypothetical protein [Mesorhizobium sp. 131-2-5]BCH05738.1 hypothetical protein MesoLj131b_77370 [Mesorhizobium sp. 131-2-5]